MRYQRSVLILIGILAATSLSGCFFPKKAVTPKPHLGGTGSETVRGTVRSADGAPLQGVEVTVQGTGIKSVTDQDGIFQLQGVPAGDVSLGFSKDQYVMAVRQLQVGGQPVVTNVQLESLDDSLHNGLLATHGYSKKCETCHKLHQSNPVNTGSVNGLCFMCHDGRNRGPVKATFLATGHSAQPVDSTTLPVWEGTDPSKRGDCTICHEPHGTDGTRAMLKAGTVTNSNALCQTCHSANGSGNTSRWPGWSSYARTTNLHGNPPLPGGGTLRTYPGKAYAAGECLNCHEPHGVADGQTVTPAMTRAGGASLCMQCHTGFKARIPAGTTVRHRCSLCHNPHLVESGNLWLVDKDNPKSQATTDSKKVFYREKTLIADSYCLGCHYSGNSYGAPLYQNSGFRDSRYASGNSLSDLHAVHLRGPLAGSGSNHSECTPCHYPGEVDGSCFDPGCHGHPDYYFGYTPGLNKMHCVDCHDVHPTSGPSRPAGMSSKLLRTDRIPSISPAGGAYNGKASCTTTYPCHYNSVTGSYNSTSCDWCHAGTTAGVGSPGGNCWSGPNGVPCHQTSLNHQTVSLP